MAKLTAHGQIKDISGNANHGSITGTVDAPGKIGRAREFDGGSDRVVAFVPVAGFRRWTVALWVKWADGPNIYEHPIALGTSHDATFWFSGTSVAFKTTDAFGNTVVDKGLSNDIAQG